MSSFKPANSLAHRPKIPGDQRSIPLLNAVLHRVHGNLRTHGGRNGIARTATLKIDEGEVVAGSQRSSSFRILIARLLIYATLIARVSSAACVRLRSALQRVRVLQPLRDNHMHLPASIELESLQFYHTRITAELPVTQPTKRE